MFLDLIFYIKINKRYYLVIEFEIKEEMQIKINSNNHEFIYHKCYFINLIYNEKIIKFYLELLKEDNNF
jgi:hypothetical protein